MACSQQLAKSLLLLLRNLSEAREVAPVKIRVFATLLLLSLAAAQDRGELKSKSAVVMIAFAGSREVLAVNGNAVTYGKDLLLVLSELRNSLPSSAEGLVLADERIHLDTVLNARGALYKAGFSRSRVFIFDKHRDSMFEIKLFPSIPYDASGHVPPDPGS